MLNERQITDAAENAGLEIAFIFEKDDKYEIYFSNRSYNIEITKSGRASKFTPLCGCTVFNPLPNVTDEASVVSMMLASK